MIASELAPAKVNLTLHVTGRRADGYHLLDSLVVFTELGDIVSARPARGLSLSLEGPEAVGLSVGPENLVWRAAQAMGAEDLALLLSKTLPLSSGIGGGSSDAAACLRLIAQMTGKALPSDEQALMLGADVPVCLTRRFCRMEGVGEQVTVLPPCPDIWLVLVNPRVEVSTPKVFHALSQPNNPPMAAKLPQWRDAKALSDWLKLQRNDLQIPACNLLPEISHVLDALSASSGCLFSRMSGSGATCFGLYGQEDAARRAAEALNAACPQWWIRSTGILYQ